METTRQLRKKRQKRFYTAETIIPWHSRLIKKHLPRLSLYFLLIACLAFTLFLSAHSYVNLRLAIYKLGSFPPSYYNYVGLMLFIITLFLFLDNVSLLNYLASKKILMLIVYFFMTATVLGLCIFFSYLYRIRLDDLYETTAGTVLSDVTKLTIVNLKIAIRSVWVTIIFTIASPIWLIGFGLYRRNLVAASAQEAKIIAAGNKTEKLIEELKVSYNNRLGQDKGKRLRIDDAVHKHQISIEEADALKKRMDDKLAQEEVKYHAKMALYLEKMAKEKATMATALIAFDKAQDALDRAFYTKWIAIGEKQIKKYQDKIASLQEATVLFEKACQEEDQKVKKEAAALMAETKQKAADLTASLSGKSEEEAESIKAQINQMETNTQRTIAYRQAQADRRVNKGKRKLKNKIAVNEKMIALVQVENEKRAAAIKSL